MSGAAVPGRATGRPILSDIVYAVRSRGDGVLRV